MSLGSGELVTFCPARLSWKRQQMVLLAEIQKEVGMIRRFVILTAFASASILFGQTGTGPVFRVPPVPNGSFEELKENLGLTTFQVEQLVAILQEKATALQETYKQIAQKESELYSLLNSGSQDVNRIGQLTLDIHNLRTQPPLSNNEYRQRALAILTPDQKTKLAILEQALRLNPPAYQAVTLNLIDGPPGQILPLPAVPSIMGRAETLGIQALP